MVQRSSEEGLRIVRVELAPAWRLAGSHADAVLQGRERMEDRLALAARGWTASAPRGRLFELGVRPDLPPLEGFASGDVRVA